MPGDQSGTSIMIFLLERQDVLRNEAHLSTAFRWVRTFDPISLIVMDAPQDTTHT
jgi:hypothetical protein